MRKLLALALVLTMVFALAVPAMAATATMKNVSMTIADVDGLILVGDTVEIAVTVTSTSGNNNVVVAIGDDKQTDTLGNRVSKTFYFDVLADTYGTMDVTVYLAEVNGSGRVNEETNATISFFVDDIADISALQQLLFVDMQQIDGTANGPYTFETRLVFANFYAKGFTFLMGPGSDYADAEVKLASVWQEEIDALVEEGYAAIAGLVTKADLINNLTDVQINAGLKIDGKVLTLNVGGDIYTLSTNANNLNQSGTVTTNGVTIQFDIKGNGSNIKLFAIN